MIKRLLLCLPLLATPALAVTTAMVSVPVADLRSNTYWPQPKLGDQEQTQLLFGETVEVVQSSGDWVEVRASEQPAFRYHQRWEGYPGWVLKKNLALGEPPLPSTHVVHKTWLPVMSTPIGFLQMRLPLGAWVNVIGHKDDWSEISLPGHHTGWVKSADLLVKKTPPKAQLRKKILDTAALLIGDPYLWGGLSPLDDTHQLPLNGIDCSGLIHLSFRVNGLKIPRDSAEQYLRAKKLKRSELKPGDLIFSAPADHPDQIGHVMFYTGDDDLLEAPHSGLSVRKITTQERLGKPIKALESGDRLPERVIYFGRLLFD